MWGKLEPELGKVKIKMIASPTQPPLRSPRDAFRIESMTAFTSLRHAHSHHGLTGRGALLRVHVRL
jgi:hypothetical protein